MKEFLHFSRLEGQTDKGFVGAFVAEKKEGEGGEEGTISWVAREDLGGVEEKKRIGLKYIA